MKELNQLPGDRPSAMKPTNSVTVEQIIKSLPEGQQFDAREILNRHPHLANSSVAYVELVIEQYCRAMNAGEQIDRQAFASRYATHLDTLTVLLETEAAFRLAMEEPDWPEAGEEYLGFHLDLELGGGKLSRVFLAREIDVANRHVVLKVCSGDRREGEVLGNLNHPSICRVYSVRHDPSRDLSAICMPFEGTTTLADLIVDGPPETSEERRGRLKKILTYAIQTAEALEYIHGNQVVHGDVKPANILIADDDARLIDFNVSFQEGSAVEQLYGTLQYLAPEHLNAAPDGASGRRGSTEGDVYAWGRTFFQAIHGILPDGRDWNSPHDRRLETEREFRSSNPPRIPTQELPREFRALDRLLSDCLAEDTAARPTAQELVRRLQQIETQQKPQPRGSVFTGRRVAIAIGLLAVVFVIAFIPKKPPSEGNESAHENRKKSDQVDNAIIAIEQGRYRNAIEILEPLAKKPGDQRDTLEEMLAYCYARQALLIEDDDKQALDLLRKATVILERLTATASIGKEALDRQGITISDVFRRRYESLGWCRIETLRHRPPLPTNDPPGEFKTSFDRMRKTWRIGTYRTFRPDMLALGDCLQKMPDDMEVNFWSVMYFRMIATKLPTHEFAEPVPTRALEYLWTATCLTGNEVNKAKFFFQNLSNPTVGLRDNDEFRYVLNRGFKPPKLTLPPKP